MKQNQGQPDVSGKAKHVTEVMRTAIKRCKLSLTTCDVLRLYILVKTLVSLVGIKVDRGVVL